MNPIVEKAREYLGTPFHHQGRRKGVGIDCVGLLVCVARELGLVAHDARGYSMRPDGHTLIDQIAKSCDRIPVAEAGPGDILIFHFLSESWPQHAGIATDRGMIHTYSHVGKVVEHELDAEWIEHINSAWRYRSA